MKIRLVLIFLCLCVQIVNSQTSVLDGIDFKTGDYQIFVTPFGEPCYLAEIGNLVTEVPNVLLHVNKEHYTLHRNSNFYRMDSIPLLQELQKDWKFKEADDSSLSLCAFDYIFYVIKNNKAVQTILVNTECEYIKIQNEKGAMQVPYNGVAIDSFLKKSKRLMYEHYQIYNRESACNIVKQLKSQRLFKINVTEDENSHYNDYQVIFSLKGTSKETPKYLSSKYKSQYHILSASSDYDNPSYGVRVKDSVAFEAIRKELPPLEIIDTYQYSGYEMIIDAYIWY